MIKIGLIGYGYWGPKLAKCFSKAKGGTLAAIVDVSPLMRERAKAEFPNIKVLDNYQALVNDKEIDAVAIATPVSTHYELAKIALQNGKDVFIEKPITRTLAEAIELERIAKENNRIIAVDHTFLFTGAVQKMKQLVSSGEIGKLNYIDSVRINLGLFQHDVNVIYDLAPHDLSILFHLVDKDPISVSAQGTCHSNNGIENVAYLHLEFADNFIAHFHFNWLSPVKIRKTLIAGEKKMIVFDDMEPSEKVRIYDTGISFQEKPIDEINKIKVDYRTGDMLAPKLSHHEALMLEADHFVDCVAKRTKPISSVDLGIRVMKVLEASILSLKNDGKKIKC